MRRRGVLVEPSSGITPETEPGGAGADVAVSLLGVSKAFLNRDTAGEVIDNVVFEDIDLDVKVGKFLTIVGPSGCGKTTLLSCIGGLIPYDSGHIILMGDRVDGPMARCATVFQHASLLPWWTIQRNVEYGLKLARTKDRSDRKVAAMAAMELVGLDPKRLGNQYPHQLSGGMQQRVNVARALATEPAVLLMDEPFGALDAITRETLQDELMKIVEKTACTVIFITHDIEEALLLGDELVMMAGTPGSIVVRERLPWSRSMGRQVVASPEFQAMAEHLRNALRTGRSSFTSQ